MEMTKTLFEAAYHCIMASEPLEKVQLSQQTAHAWNAGKLSFNATYPIQTIVNPGLPTDLHLVPARDVPHRKMSTPLGQAALLHALAHIEFNAINLAWDAVYRFRTLPQAFYDDWVKVANEEATHFMWLQEQLQQLSYTYGDFPAHNGLWEMALETTEDVLTRMALVPRVLEARGLDATPPIIAKLQAQGLHPIADILKRILHDEIGHVAIGSRWFAHCCAERGLEVESTFQSLVAKHFKGRFKPPLNREARLAAGFSAAELDNMLTQT